LGQIYKIYIYKYKQKQQKEKNIQTTCILF